MRRIKLLLCLNALLIMVLTSGPLLAQIQKKLPFRRMRKTNEASFKLTESDGPWLIMCASFGGDDAMTDAKKLASELRKNNLKSYVYQHKFDRPSEVEGLEMERFSNADEGEGVRRQRMKFASLRHDEIAVLVGDFPAIEDSRAQRMLREIKQLNPDSLATSTIDAEADPLRDWREFARRNGSGSEEQPKGPMRLAFLLPNPLFPDEYFDSVRVDSFVLNLNKRVKHSLLNNPQRFSVRVATFRGSSTFAINESDKLERERGFLKRLGKPVVNSKLADAAAKANRLTEELRKLGVDAYEFHDRSESYVCVGGFDWVTRSRGGQGTYNPEVARVVNKFKGHIRDIPNMKGALQPKQLPSLRKTDIVFDIAPTPVEVPKMPIRSIGLGDWK